MVCISVCLNACVAHNATLDDDNSGGGGGRRRAATLRRGPVAFARGLHSIIPHRAWALMRVLAWAALLGAIACTCTAAAPEKPNVLLFFPDVRHALVYSLSSERRRAAQIGAAVAAQTLTRALLYHAGAAVRLRRPAQ